MPDNDNFPKESLPPPAGYEGNPHWAAPGAVCGGNFGVQPPILYYVPAVNPSITAVPAFNQWVLTGVALLTDPGGKIYNCVSATFDGGGPQDVGTLSGRIFIKKNGVLLYNDDDPFIIVKPGGSPSNNIPLNVIEWQATFMKSIPLDSPNDKIELGFAFVGWLSTVENPEEIIWTSWNMPHVETAGSQGGDT